MTATPRIDPSHAAHDAALVAAFADRDAAEALSPSELVVATRLVADCEACAALHADLLILAAGLRTAATPRRTRDFRLTPADAARLQPGGWRRILATIGSARDGVTRPLAVGLTTLGLIGVLVGTVPGALPFGGAAGAAVAEDQTSSAVPALVPSAQGPAAAPGASPDVGTMTAGPDTAGTEGEGDASTDGAPAASSGATDPTDRIRAQSSEELSSQDETTGMSVPVVVGGTLLILGLGLFALRWTARRRS
ncbi:MAG: hypothetical protein ACLGIJ_13990 [Candidatus Limnocylindria bacterium]